MSRYPTAKTSADRASEGIDGVGRLIVDLGSHDEHLPKRVGVPWQIGRQWGLGSGDVKPANHTPPLLKKSSHSPWDLESFSKGVHVGFGLPGASFALFRGLACEARGSRSPHPLESRKCFPVSSLHTVRFDQFGQFKPCPDCLGGVWTCFFIAWKCFGRRAVQPRGV